MGRRSEHTREEQREMALCAARGLVESKGVQGLTTRAVAARMGYAVGTLYHLFNNLDDLVYALNAQTVAQLREAMESALAGLRSPRKKLLAIAHAYLEFALANANLWRLAFEYQPSDHGPTPAVIRQQTDPVILIGVAAFKELSPAAKPDQLRLRTAAFWSGIHGVCHLTLTDTLKIATGQSAGHLLDTQVKTFLDGVAA